MSPAEEVACPSCGELNPARAKFCLECGTRMPEATPYGEPESGERRIVTVLFADLSGFTSFSERSDPEEVRALAHEAAGRLGEVVLRYGGTVDKVIGDAVMAVFGAPESHEDDPERAVRAAIDMQAYVDQNREKFAGLPLRIGINTGEAMFAPVGPGGQYTVIGDTVNTAARLQSGAAKGDSLVGEATYRATSEAIELEPVPPLTAKGKEEPVPAWRAVSVKGVRPVRPSVSAPLIGRTEEFDRLWELWERVRTERRPYLASVLGAPGIGKSRLLHEFAGRLEGNASLYWGRCLSYGEGITYWPVTEILKEAAGILHSDDQEAISARLGEFLEGLGTDDLDQLRTMAAALAVLVGVPVTPRGTYSVGDISQAELHWGIRRIFELLSEHQPTVLVFEDVHWAEPTLHDLIAFILESGVDAPILILASARPELKESEPPILAATWNRRVIELEALGNQQTEALLNELVGKLELSGPQIAALLEASGGNPLFLEETVRMLADAALAGEHEPERVVPVPQSLHALLSSRLDRLTKLERRTAQHASVIGSVFWPGAVRHLGAETGDEEVELGLEALEVRDFVHENEVSTVAGEREFAFKHAMIRDVAYGRLPKARRSELHVRCADWISLLPGTEEEFLEIVAYHLEEACRLARQVKRSSVAPPVLRATYALSRAAQKAERREGIREADRFYVRALDVVGADHPELATEIRLRRCGTLIALGDLSQADEQLAEVAARAQTLGRLDLRCEALLSLANVYWQQGRPADARESFSNAEPIASEIKDQRLQIKRDFELASLAGWFDADYATATEYLRSAVKLAEEIGDRGLRIEGHMRLGGLLFNVGELAKAEDQLSRAVALAGELGSHRDEARAISMLGFVKFYRGDAETAQRLAQQALEWRDRTSDSFLEVQNVRALAKYALVREDLEEAERHLRDVVPLASQMGGWVVGEVYMYLTRALVRQGRLEEAQETVAAAKSAVPEDDAYAQAAVSLAEGSVAAARGDEPAARESYDRAVSLLTQQDLTMDLAEARLEYAQTLRRFEDRKGARAQLLEARQVFAGAGASGLLAEVERGLAELDEGAGGTRPLVP